MRTTGLKNPGLQPEPCHKFAMTFTKSVMIQDLYVHPPLTGGDTGRVLSAQGGCENSIR